MSMRFNPYLCRGVKNFMDFRDNRISYVVLYGMWVDFDMFYYNIRQIFISFLL